MPTDYKPYVPPDQSPKELTIKALVLGVVLAVLLGFTNAYLGLKAGMTVAATFPAAVIAMAFLKMLRGSILEENMSRTTASVGEALVAGAIFTIPAFLMARVDGEPIWESLRDHYAEATVIMLVGGVLGVLFVIIVRRALVEESDLPFPESVACSEIVKAGQSGRSGAKYVFGSLGLAMLIELFKNPRGVQIMGENFVRYLAFDEVFGQSRVALYKGSTPIGDAPLEHGGGVILTSPVPSPALLGVGYIIGPRYAAITFSGGVLGWLVLCPLALFFNNDLESLLGQSIMIARGGQEVEHIVTWADLATAAYSAQIKPIAVGAMLVGAFWTLWSMRTQLLAGVGKALGDMRRAGKGEGDIVRTSKDLPFKWVLAAIGVLIIPMIILYHHFTQNWAGAVVAALVMAAAGLLFTAVAGYLVGVIGASSNPISGLTLSTLLIAALLMRWFGISGAAGIAATLGVAAVVCCACGIAGDMMQDLKVGHILGGTPWRMQVGEIVGVILSSLVMVVPLIILHEGTPGGIGGRYLPAPQAGLMAMMSQGIIGGEMAWPLIIVGMAFAVGLILLGAPSPMLIAVGIYLPFGTTAAIFVGGVIKWILTLILEHRKVAEAARKAVANVGELVSSGLIAGEALVGVAMAGLALLGVERIAHVSESPLVSLLVVFPVIAAVLIILPLRSLREGGSSSSAE